MEDELLSDSSAPWQSQLHTCGAGGLARAFKYLLACHLVFTREQDEKSLGLRCGGS